MTKLISLLYNSNHVEASSFSQTLVLLLVIPNMSKIYRKYLYVVQNFRKLF